jgi:3-deoxy-D-manno-octulosonate 8-phosphate phosphatase (KDO 8-P phosphatase)
MGIFKEPLNPKTFVLDLDGVFTDGAFLYSKDGKVMKVFGADDHDALKILDRLIEIHVITADRRGFDISQRRVSGDMGFNLSLVSSENRVEWLQRHYDLDTLIYMGDGIFDPRVFRAVAYSICPSNALRTTKRAASHVTVSRGGDRAVAEAVIHILKKFFGKSIKNSDFF